MTQPPRSRRHRQPYRMRPRPHNKPKRERPDRFSAWLALAGVVVGAAAAGYFSSIVTEKQISATASQSTSFSLREQRRIAYSAFVTDEAVIRGLEKKFDDLASDHLLVSDSDGAFGNIRYSDDPSGIDGLMAIKQPYLDALAKLEQDLTSIKLCGSPGVVSAAELTVGWYKSYRYRYDDVSGDGVRSGLPGRLSEQHTGSMNRFLNEARADFGAGPI